MNQHLTQTRCLLAGLMALGLCAAPHQLRAQAFGGIGIGTGTTRSTATSYGSSSQGTIPYSAPGQVGQAMFSIDQATRSLVVVADPKTYQDIARVIANMDRPKPQVTINVVFVEVTRNNSFDLGVEVGGDKSLGNPGTLSGTQSWGLSDIGSVVSSNALTRFNLPASSFGSTGAGVMSLVGNQYSVVMRALEQSGKAKVLSRPSITVLNNQPATITVGQNVPLVSGTRVDNYGNVINTLSYTSVGIILQVTPFITSDGNVEMIVDPEISDLVQDRSQWVQISSGTAGSAAAPIINTRSADTVVITPDGETVMIGGLMEDTKASSQNGIPFLSSIPLLGTLFKHSTRTDEKTELMIFLTPHIIWAPSEIKALTQHWRKQSPGLRADVADKELDSFLDQIPATPRPALPRVEIVPQNPAHGGADAPSDLK